ncbi:hypothetical protein ABW20_dc0101256 [Dactylellina cionopaga]|nr:hypothetical protein ABW20_dc0101256 [Dactylellina cionopaga]
MRLKSLSISIILSSGLLIHQTTAGPLPEVVIRVSGGKFVTSNILQPTQVVVPPPPVRSTNQDTIPVLSTNQGSVPAAGPNTSTPDTNTTQNNLAKPRSIGIVAFRGWQPLDIMGPFDALWGLSRKVPLNVYFLNAEGGTTTNFIPGTTAEGSQVAAVINVDYTLANPPPLDVVLVPGGLGTRQPEAELAPYIDFVKKVYPSLQYLISVCTGASILARAGLLDGKQATTNKKAWKFVTQFGTGVKWQPRARYVHDQNIWTTSGVSAGTDGVLGWIESIWGAEIANDIANDMEWNRSPADGDKFGELFGAQ